jgi:hypothetical protein
VPQALVVLVDLALLLLDIDTFKEYYAKIQSN